MSLTRQSAASLLSISALLAVFCLAGWWILSTPEIILASIEANEMESRAPDADTAAVGPSGTAVQRTVAGSNHPTPDAALLAHIQGRVVDPNGKPLAQVAVESSRGGTALTDASGRFSLDGATAGDHWLTARSDGWIARPSAPARVVRGSSVNDVILVMEPSRVLHARVHDPDGAPVIGAVIEPRVRQFDHGPEFLRHSARTTRVSSAALSDDRGRFTVSGLPDGLVELIVRHPDYHDFTRVVPTDAQQIQLRLTPAPAIVGRVRSASTGNPVAIDRLTVLCSAADRHGPWKPLGDAIVLEGHDSLEGRFQARTHGLSWLRVIVEGPAIVPTASEVFRASDHSTAPLLIAAKSASVQQCKVLDQRGAAIADADLELEELESSCGLKHRSRRTNSHGIADLGQLGTGRYRITAHCRGFSSRSIEAVVPPSSPSAASPWIVSLRGAATVQVALLGSGGQLPPLTAIATPVDGDQEQPSTADASVLLPIDGARSEFPPLPPGATQFRLIDRNDPAHVYYNELLHLTGESTHSLEVDLGREHAIVSGTYIRDGQPVRGAPVQLDRTSVGASWTCITDSFGQFHFAGVTPGTLFLKAPTNADGTCFFVSSINVPAPTRIRHDLTVQTGTLSGRLLDGRGQPLRRARIRLEQAGHEGPFSIVGELVTDARGRFSAERVPAGALLVSTSAPHAINVQRRPIDVPVAGVTQFEERLDRAGSLILHLGRTGSMATNVPVEVELRPAAEGPASRCERFEPGNTIRLGELPAGPCHVTVRTGDGFLARTEATVIVGRDQTVLVRF